MIAIEQCIEFLAAYGASKHSVATVLDIPMETFLDMCKAMPDAKWRPKGQTIGDRRSMRRRQFSAKRRREILQSARRITLDEQVTVLGRTGTLREMIDAYSTVTRRSVLHRIRLGCGVEEAVLKPTNRGPARRAS